MTRNSDVRWRSKVLKSSHEQSDEANRRFMREAQAISKIDHPNVVTLFDIIQQHEEHYMVMQYLEGSTLRERLAGGRMNLGEVLRIACEIASGLAAAHRVGIIHRDLKPENVMSTATGHNKVLDFGIAHLIDRTTLTSTGQLVGTLSYMAPEQIQGERIDERVDIYSLGVLIYEMLAGRPPFDSEKRAVVMYQVMNEDPVSLRTLMPDLPEEIDRIVSKAISRNPDDRYGSIEEMLHDLEVVRKLSDVRRVEEKLIARRKPPLGWKHVSIVVGILLAFVIINFLGRKDAGEAHRIVVLKWENTADDSDYNWLSSAIMDRLIRTLGRLEGFNIVSRHTVNSTLNTFKQASAAGLETFESADPWQRIGAAYMVSGRFEPRGHNLDITCELSDVSDGTLVASWTDEIPKTIRNPMVEFYHVIDRFAQKIAAELGAEWAEEPSRQAPHTVSIDALKHFQISTEYYEVRNIPETLKHLRLAVRYDSTFTNAHLYLARITRDLPERSKHLDLAMKYRYQAPNQVRWLAEAENLAERNEIELAIEKYESVLGENPESVIARSTIATMLLSKRRFEEAAMEFGVLRSINPLDFSYYNDWSTSYIEIGRKDRAVKILEDWRRTFPNEVAPLMAIISVQQALGFYDRALALCDTLAEISPGAELAQRGFILMHLGRLGAAAKP